jgi:hypothetical protein
MFGSNADGQGLSQRQTDSSRARRTAIHQWNGRLIEPTVTHREYKET